MAQLTSVPLACPAHCGVTVQLPVIAVLPATREQRFPPHLHGAPFTIDCDPAPLYEHMLATGCRHADIQPPLEP